MSTDPQTTPPASPVPPESPADSYRFAILEHDHPFAHWDLLLEDGQSAWTWRLLTPPFSVGWQPAEQLPPHRLHYLDYSGPVSGNRGTVRQVASGRYRVVWSAGIPLSELALPDSPKFFPDAAISDAVIVVRFVSASWGGWIELRPQPTAGLRRWQIAWLPDTTIPAVSISTAD